jgi:hypothetical protein
MRRHDRGLTDIPRLRLNEPVDVLAAVPYLIGYHPARSLVLLGLRGKELVFTARNDLPSEAHDLPMLVSHLLDVVLRQALTAVLIVGYGSEEEVRPAALTLRDACAGAQLRVVEVLRAHEGRYWSYLCRDPICCPTEGSPYDANTSAVAAAWTVAGRVALPDRQSYEDQIKSVGGLTRISMHQATDRASNRLLALLGEAPDEASAETALMAAGNQAIGAALDTVRAGERLDDDAVAWLTVLLVSIPVRDLAWARIQGSLAEMDHHRTLWIDVLCRAEPDLIAAPGSLFAFAAWRCGEGALARMALERVLAEDPDYNMADLLLHALAHGLPPSALRDFPGPGPGRRPARRSRRRSRARRASTRRA